MLARIKRAIVAFAAVLASFCFVFALCQWAGASNGPALLAAILAMSLSRSPQSLDLRRALETVGTLAATALAALGLARLFEQRPIAGAIVFVFGIGLSIWLRNFGERARKIGAMIATPLVVILVVPARAAAPGGPIVDLALVLAAAVIAIVSVNLAQRIGAIAGISIGIAGSLESPPRAKGTRLSIPTRMAMQMMIALGAAFAIGFIMFPAHWGWVVLTAYLVGSATVGRGDVAYKSVLRFAGALSGTIAAMAIAHVGLPDGVGGAAAIFVILFVGLALRDLSYAYWAGCMTLILALLSRWNAAFDIAVLGVRLEAIVVGALCTVCATWFVFPIRTEAVIRRRLAEALVALDELVEHAHESPEARAEKLRVFEARIAEIERVAAPAEWHRRLSRSHAVEHPAHWIAIARGFSAHARTLGSERILMGTERAELRRAIGTSRRAIAEHGDTAVKPDSLPPSQALARIHASLAGEPDA